MHKLTHFRLCPRSRAIRLALAEVEVAFELAEEKPWELRPEFLALNPAAELPVLHLENGPILCGAYAIAEYMAEEVRTHPKDGRAVPLLPGTREERAEVRRLLDWFHGKLDREVTREMLHEKVYARMRPESGHTPAREVMQAIRANLRYHLSYLGYLADQRRWLAGEELSLADLAAAAHLSTLDYLSELTWDGHPSVKAWYVRVKSRPSFRPLLSDRQPGVAPPPHYADLDF
jgi:glutathione S-transferase